MGKQVGTVRLTGTVGNLTFTKTENGEEARLKSTLSGDRMKNDKRFKRTRENWAEFRNAGKAAKLIRNAFSKSAKPITDRYAYSRLMVKTMQIVKSDPSSDRGKRQIALGDLNYLLGYDFNKYQSLESTFTESIDIAIDRVAGTADISIPEIQPDKVIETMDGATHFKLLAAVSELDWDENKYIYDGTETSELVYGNQLEAAQALSLNFTPDSDKSLVLVFGIIFYQEVNGKFYHLQDGKNNSMAILAVDQI